MLFSLYYEQTYIKHKEYSNRLKNVVKKFAQSKSFVYVCSRLLKIQYN